MRLMNKLYVLLACLVATSTYAQDAKSELNSTPAQSLMSAFNVGAGITQGLVHLNAEWVNPYGIAYVKGGVFFNDNYIAGGQLGFRRAVHLTGKDLNGYYLGAYAGHIDAKWVGDKHQAQLGGGVDLSYVMLSRERISSLSVGIGAGEKLEDNHGNVVAETEPKLQFSYTLSVGL